MLKHYFKVAFRNLIKNKARSIISILGLVAGIFCFTTTNYYGRAFYRGDEVFPEYNRMARIYLKYEGNLALLAPTKDAPAQKEDIEQVLEFDLPEVEYAATFSETSYYNIEMTADGHRNHLYTVAAMNVNADFMHVYPSRFLEGSVEQFTSRPLMALVTRSFVNQLGINEQPVGKTFTTVSRRDEELEHPAIYTIAGVIEDYPAFTSFTLFGRNIDMLLLNDGGNQCTFLLNKYIDLENLNNRIIGLQ
ncbi:ABC transporter permease, partial [Bacteroides sp. OttesenSCG-928-E20]|nr:ABC transporter permease [Bacteroides sp. OttesenSCG-928-E20]